MNTQKNDQIPKREDIWLLRKKLVRWFRNNKREYPWRHTEDPFKFLIAEIMLRRTKADQVKPVYENFFKKFPNIKSIISADINTINNILYPLGLNKRYSKVIMLAEALLEHHNCRLLLKRAELKKLPGIGDYSAGALLSIVYKKREWIVDNNVVRLFSRYFGIKLRGEGRRDNKIISIAKEYISKGDPKKSNLALLDFSALICQPKSPKCKSCLLKELCFYYKNFKNYNQPNNKLKVINIV